MFTYANTHTHTSMYMYIHIYICICQWRIERACKSHNCKMRVHMWQKAQEGMAANVPAASSAWRTSNCHSLHGCRNLSLHCITANWMWSIDWLKLLVAGSTTSSQTPQQDGILHTIPPYFYEQGSPTSSHTLQTDGMLHTECCRLIADARQVQRKMAANVPRRSDAESLSCLHGCLNPYPRSVHTCKQAKIAKHCITQHGRPCKWHDQ